MITFTKHENRENLILRNSRNSQKFRETREHFFKFCVSRKSSKDFHHKPFLRAYTPKGSNYLLDDCIFRRDSGYNIMVSQYGVREGVRGRGVRGQVSGCVDSQSGFGSLGQFLEQ